MKQVLVTGWSETASAVCQSTSGAKIDFFPATCVGFRVPTLVDDDRPGSQSHRAPRPPEETRRGTHVHRGLCDASLAPFVATGKKSSGLEQDRDRRRVTGLPVNPTVHSSRAFIENFPRLLGTNVRVSSRGKIYNGPLYVIKRSNVSVMRNERNTVWNDSSNGSSRSNAHANCGAARTTSVTPVLVAWIGGAKSKSVRRSTCLACVGHLDLCGGCSTPAAKEWPPKTWRTRGPSPEELGWVIRCCVAKRY